MHEHAEELSQHAPSGGLHLSPAVKKVDVGKMLTGLTMTSALSALEEAVGAKRLCLDTLQERIT